MRRRNESAAPLVALMIPKQNKAFITFARNVHDAMENNAAFPNPDPTLAAFKGNIDAFEEAETKAATRVKGASALRDAKKQSVKEDIFHLRDYVQRIVETTASPAAATALIESAFMTVRKQPQRSIPDIRANNADVSGKVTLTARSLARSATYFWEYSLDQSTWTLGSETMHTRTEVSGLTSARTYYFRFRALTPKGAHGYSQVVSLVVS